MAIFYHVSRDLRHDGAFVPRIPQHRYEFGEEALTLRISVGCTLEGCLTAIPDGGCGLYESNYERRGYYKVFRVDTEKLGIPDSAIISSQTLWENDQVWDADITNEYWILQAFQVPPEDSYCIKLDRWEEETVDIAPYSIVQEADRHYEGNLGEAFLELMSDHLPCGIQIDDAHYVSEHLTANSEVTLFVDFIVEREWLRGEIEVHPDLRLISDDFDNFRFLAVAETNVKALFLAHAAYAETLHTISENLLGL